MRRALVSRNRPYGCIVRRLEVMVGDASTDLASNIHDVDGNNRILEEHRTGGGT